MRPVLLYAAHALLLCACSATRASSASENERSRRTSEGYFEGSDHVRLYYHTVGDAPDTVVVIHGGPGLHMNYLVADLAPLAADVTLLFYDQRGSGRSETVADTARLSAAKHIEDLEALRQHFGLKKLKLIGHSWGGLLAGVYAARYPNNLDRLLLLDSDPPARVPFWSKFNPAARVGSAGRRQMAAVTGWEESPDPERGCRIYWSAFIRGYYASPDRAAQMHGDVCDAPPQTWRNRKNTRYARASLGNWNLIPELSKFRFPVLIIHGSEDPMPLEGAEAWQRNLPNAQLIIIRNAGHFPHVESPEEFFREARKFLRTGNVQEH